MKLTEHIAKHAYEIYFGGNWTTTNLKGVLEDVTWKEATTQVDGFNTLATLVFHVNYFPKAVSAVLEGKPLESKDSLSFDHPPINSEVDWKSFLESVWEDGKRFSELITSLPESQLNQPFTDEKYGSYYRNLHGIIEHLHYHLGQIVILKKLIKSS